MLHSRNALRTCIFTLCLLAFSFGANAQLKLQQDTFSCPLVGVHFGTVLPSAASTEGGMHSLYKAPFLDYGIDAIYKFKSNILLSLDGSLVMGSDNLKDREARMGDVYTDDSYPIVVGTNGTDAVVTCYNRALTLRVGAGKVFTIGDKNPNSGVALRLMAGIMQQKTIFMLNDVNAPQLDGDYARLYDHKRRGGMLTESIGYWFMSNQSNLFNFYVAFELTQCWNHSVREYVIDNVMGLHGPDNTRYFDLLYSLKICWMFPLRGQTVYDYYFY